MRRVLVVAYFFPPLGGAGVQRTLRLVRHLRDIEWEPEVLTVGASGYPYRDEAALSNLPDGLAVHRVEASDPERFQQSLGTSLPGKVARKVLTEWLYPLLYVPDRFVPWARQASKTAAELLRSGRFDLVYASVPPFSSVLPGTEPASYAGLPCVLDFRDLWTANTYQARGQGSRRQQAQERRALGLAAEVIVATEGFREVMAPMVQAGSDRVTVIRNGYDKALLPPVGGTPGGALRLVHAGTLYGGRHIDALVDAVAGVREAGSDVSLTLIGDVPSRTSERIARLGEGSGVELCGRVGYAKVLETLAGADASVTVQVAGRDLPNVPAKVYEAMGLRRPVLLLGDPRGETAEVLDRAGMLYLAEPDDVASCLSALQVMYADKRAGRLGATIDEDYVASFDITRQITQFGEVFDRAVARRS